MWSVKWSVSFGVFFDGFDEFVSRAHSFPRLGCPFQRNGVHFGAIFPCVFALQMGDICGIFAKLAICNPNGTWKNRNVTGTNYW